ncbi:hypothetical protein AB3S75_012870 [Citrus x aurantiifolia]
MRKKLDTRFPAARIKKIMQADEDVGKIALAVPVLVSKALELFLQDLCDRTYEITLQRGAKTMSSLHLTKLSLKVSFWCVWFHYALMSWSLVSKLSA